MPTAKLGRYAPTGKLGHSNIKFEAAHPDGVELIKVERTIFEKQPKIFPVGKFLALPFFKKVAKKPNTN